MSCALCIACTDADSKASEPAQASSTPSPTSVPPASSLAAPATTTGAFIGTASQRTPVPVAVLDEEYDMVHQAFATDSQDQSPWMYYRWDKNNFCASHGIAVQCISACVAYPSYSACSIAVCIGGHDNRRHAVDMHHQDCMVAWPAVCYSWATDQVGDAVAIPWFLSKTPAPVALLSSAHVLPQSYYRLSWLWFGFNL